jgi:hypothetical protein
VNRLYQWLRKRAISFRVLGLDGEPIITRRTEITVQEHQRTVLLTGSAGVDDAICPLCGQPIDLDGCVDALHAMPSIAQVKVPGGATRPAREIGPAVAAETLDPPSVGSEKLRVVSRRLR